MTIKTYAGIGSRDITVGEHITINKVASLLSDMGVILFSGNAPGADQAFQKGSKGKNIVFIPWTGFEKDSFDYERESLQYYVLGNSPEGLKSIQKFHPAPQSLSEGARKLMARNYHQICGAGECPQVSFVVCCVNKDSAGNYCGGTSQALRIAKSLNIPIYNIRENGWSQNLKEYLKLYSTK